MDVAALRADVILSAILKKPVIYINIMAGIKGGGGSPLLFDIKVGHYGQDMYQQFEGSFESIGTVVGLNP